MEYLRQKVVDLALSWLGLKESDGSYKSIIDIYNEFTGAFPRGIKMKYGWAWCACTWSAIAIKLKYTAVMPIEISCYYIIEAAKKMGIWQERDDYIPKPADAVLYDWDDNGVGDNKGNPDHIGIIVEVHQSAGYMVVVEGNYSNSVKKRTLSINGRYIRGFITPKYTDNSVSPAPTIGGKDITTVAREVIAGTWGSGETRKSKLAAAGYDYAKVQAKVNEILNGPAVKAQSAIQNPNQTVKSKMYADDTAKGFDKVLSGEYKTTADLYIRHGAGKSQKAMALIPKGTKVNNYGYYNTANGVKWLYIQVTIDGVMYAGFSHSAYLKK